MCNGLFDRYNIGLKNIQMNWCPLIILTVVLVPVSCNYALMLKQDFNCLKCAVGGWSFKICIQGWNKTVDSL